MHCYEIFYRGVIHFCRMSWILKNNPDVIKAHKDNDLMFGTLDTWLTYKLNGGQHHVTEPSNAISTGECSTDTIPFNTIDIELS